MLAVTPPEDREKVLLTDGDDNVAPETLLTKDTTLPELETEEVIKQEDNLPLSKEDEEVYTGFGRAEKAETNDDEKLHAGVDEDEELVTAPIEDKESKREVAPLLVEGIPDTENAPPIDIVPITTEFTQQELEVADKLAHETLAEVDPETGSSLFVLPAIDDQEENIPITTEFTQQELDESSRLRASSSNCTGVVL